MKIYLESKIEREMVIKDISRKPLKAMTVFFNSNTISKR
jgi:hypothetical protein